MLFVECFSLLLEVFEGDKEIVQCFRNIGWFEHECRDGKRDGQKVLFLLFETTFEQLGVKDVFVQPFVFEQIGNRFELFEDGVTYQPFSDDHVRMFVFEKECPGRIIFVHDFDFEILLFSIKKLHVGRYFSFISPQDNGIVFEKGTGSRKPACYNHKQCKQNKAEEVSRFHQGKTLRTCAGVVNPAQEVDINTMLDSPKNRFRRYSTYLKHRYGAPAYRVSVDGGFSCPNRGPDRRRGGCTYCDERGSRATYQGRARSPSSGPSNSATDEASVDCNRELLFEGLRNQVQRGIAFLEKRYRARSFLLYFQAFSSTFAPVSHLRSVYDYCLSLADFRELIVSTRPDCISEETVNLFREYQARGYEVWVELGLQSAHDTSLERINRGHTVKDFENTYALLHEAGIQVTVHLIFGLPGEGEEEIMETVEFIRDKHPAGIKIHNLHIPVGTPLFQEYLRGEVVVPSSRRHLDYTVKALEALPPDIIIMRVTCDTPDHLLAAPRRPWDKAGFYSKLDREMEQRATWQGKALGYSLDDRML